MLTESAVALDMLAEAGFEVDELDPSIQATTRPGQIVKNVRYEFD
ncbi:hypothetical protein [Paenibacillus qinlingensis]|nr:hypothetical protein [Paenibacillus qinlingensis]